MDYLVVLQLVQRIPELTLCGSNSQHMVFASNWCGKTRVAANMFWYGDFKATPHTTVQKSGGKGCGTKTSNTTFSYSVSYAWFM